MDMEKIKRLAKASMRLIPVGLLVASSQQATILSSYIDNEKKAKQLLEAGIITEKTYRRFFRKSRSNNWLKNHGYPMKRRGH